MTLPFGAEKTGMTKLVVAVIGGAVLGFLYSKFIGCRSGACPLTSNPYVATLYGAVLGGLLART